MVEGGEGSAADQTRQDVSNPQADGPAVLTSPGLSCPSASIPATAKVQALGAPSLRRSG